MFVLNPYYLARVATGENSLLNPAAGRNYDYFKMFFEEARWPYSKPIPIYSPWRDERIASQRGMFIVHGHDLRALEEIVGAP